MKEELIRLYCRVPGLGNYDFPQLKPCKDGGLEFNPELNESWGECTYQLKELVCLAQVTCLTFSLFIVCTLNNSDRSSSDTSCGSLLN